MALHLGSSGARWPDPVEGPYWVQLWWAPVAGRLQCVGIFVGSFKDVAGDGPRAVGESLEAVNSTLLRQAPVGRLMDSYLRSARRDAILFGLTQEERQELAGRLERDPWLLSAEEFLDAVPSDLAARGLARQAEGRESQGLAPASTGKPRPPGRPPTRDHAHFEDVARIYREAWAMGSVRPTVAVAKHWNVTNGTASNWITRARRLGLLGPAPRRGVAGEKPRRQQEEQS